MENPEWLLKNVRFIYINNVWKNKITQPYPKKFCALFVKKEKMVNKIICDLKKVTKSAQNRKLEVEVKLKAYLFYI